MQRTKKLDENDDLEACDRILKIRDLFGRNSVKWQFHKNSFKVSFLMVSIISLAENDDSDASDSVLQIGHLVIGVS